jgi:hypothetical protein
VQASSHFWKKHHIPKSQRNGLDQYLSDQHFKSSSLAKPRPNGSPSHPALRVRAGFQCVQCPYISTSLDLMGRHLRGSHTPDRPSARLDLDLLYQPVSIQSWTQSTMTQSYWIVNSDPSSFNRDTVNGPLEEQHCATTTTFIHNL